MKYSFRHFIKDLRKVRLSRSEQQGLRSEVAHFISAHPAPSHPQNTSLIQILVFRRSFAIGALALFLVLSGSGITYAAENALPGTILYPVKINVIEPIREAAALSPESRVQWEVQKVERRLNEAERMLGQGVLTTETGTRLAEKLQEHSNAIAEKITVLKAQDKIVAAASASNGFNAALQAHTRLLTELAQKSRNPGDAAQLLTTLELNTEAALDEADDIADQVTNTASSVAQTAAQDIGKEAEKVINQARTSYRKENKNLDSESKQKLDQYFSQLDSLQTEAQVATKDDRFSDAFILYQEAHRKAKEAKSILGSKKELKENGKIELKPEEHTPAPASTSPKQVQINEALTVEIISRESNEKNDKKESRKSRLRNLIPTTTPLDDLEIEYKEKDTDRD